MQIERLAIPEVVVLQPRLFGDDRGFFSESWNRKRLEEFGLDLDFVQDNESFSAAQGTLRGLHFQTPPHAQDKLVRCTRGRVLDVAVDIRKDSPTYGQSVKVELSAELRNQILVPKGFAHGFLTLVPDCEVQYKVTDYYSPECDANIIWNDPDLNVDWGVDPAHVTLSKKDAEAPRLAEIDPGFTYASAKSGQ